LKLMKAPGALNMTRLMNPFKNLAKLLVFVPLAALVFGQGPDPSRSHLPPMRQPANPKLPTLFIIGDSTVRNGQGDGRKGQWGWGDVIGPYFDASKINVVNWALGGRSSRTYITEGHWAKVVAELKPGDFVMMQFGHNDGGAINDKTRARGTIKGTGDETQQIVNELTGKPETVHTYGWYMRKYIEDTKAKGATPIVCSMIPRKIWANGKIVRNSGDYAGWAEQVANAEHVPFVNLNEIIARRYDAMGPEKVDPLFGDPHTHTTLAGAQLNAECVIAGLKALADDPLAPYFSQKGNAVAPAQL
jgi:lysophospholipase L1-like esterase